MKQEVLQNNWQELPSMIQHWFCTFFAAVLDSEVDFCFFFSLATAWCLALFALSSAIFFAASSLSFFFCSLSAFLLSFSSCSFLFLSSLSSRMAAHLALVRTQAPDTHFIAESLVFGVGAGRNCTKYLQIYTYSVPHEESRKLFFVHFASFLQNQMSYGHVLCTTMIPYLP